MNNRGRGGKNGPLGKCPLLIQVTLFISQVLKLEHLYIYFHTYNPSLFTP